ncbi:proline-rich protein 36-like [Dendrobium catenatum]|uniref:proline-rich protein 36-like n=1 Tax=Dendrobium catenatum TaxID=906689 RepID=UPI0009F59AA7|nr:proline-rich protein 36-like [Dendrobium catenatum]
MASFVPSVTFSFGSDARVTLPESMLASLPAGGITFGSFTDSAFVALGGPTPAEFATFSPPQKRGRAAMRPFGQPAAQRTARAPALPIPVLVQPVRPVARRPVPSPLPVPPVHHAVSRPVLTAPVMQVGPLAPAACCSCSTCSSSGQETASVAPIAQVAPAPQHQQPAVVLTSAVPAEVPCVRTPVLPVIPIPPVSQIVGSDVPSTSTSVLGRRARRNRNMSLRLAASKAERQQMAEAIAHQELVQRMVAPRQRRP